MNAAESGAVRWAMSLAVAVLLCPPYAHGWTLDLSTINPLSTTGGASVGINLEYVPGDGLAIYRVSTPPDSILGSSGIVVEPG